MVLKGRSYGFRIRGPTKKTVGSTLNAANLKHWQVCLVVKGFVGMPHSYVGTSSNNKACYSQ